jgi:BolA protein
VTAVSSSTVDEILRILRETFDPSKLEIRDDSALHAGHPGATSGGGHYHVVIVSKRFEGLSLLEQHRLVNDALRDLFGDRIHALGLKTAPPSQGQGRRAGEPFSSR